MARHTGASAAAVAPEQDIDLGAKKQREALSAPAVRLFFNLAQRWQLSVGERQILLGGIARQTYHNWQNGRISVLSRDQLERISLVLGIYKALKLVFAEDDGAMRWLKSPNHDVPFAGRSPLAHMLRGGMDDLYAVRRYLDAWRGLK
ncbi:MbcA/ParS/Xre antitoxin family protein [Rhodoligotrophos ferricapiens]|uniref:MbcA/ParS/Xre antitoxin family protein n=1 Tax=Rhodoligotrophos ferricapiens TaxID=3069264 RepID=UPI00315C5EDB